MYNEDVNCSFKYAGRPFGDNSFSFGTAKVSWLKASALSVFRYVYLKPRKSTNDAYFIKDNLSNLVLKYVESGLVQELKWRYLQNNRRCTKNLNADMVLRKLDLEHTEGLFIMLLVAMGVAFLLLCIEYVVYSSLVPRLRKKPQNSFWKSNWIAFISQNLHRSIVSEQFVSTRQIATEMLNSVKRFSFIQLFQKNESLKKVLSEEESHYECDVMCIG
ncbi:hypothetical protein CHS0354_005830 [Potamilus streckersoni]|uniref:Uncharacterized protein n=1 Tax=Potamilus streckersoni TaxID=2493646 RepID=A0AAE0VGT5_9BIVA|nr:hypothetical protein CHS0354_005830 [Potamilus streckersoni]